MKRKYIYALSALLYLGFTGCENLDTLPEGNTLTSTQKEEVANLDPKKAEAGVNAIFAQFNQYMPNSKAIGERHNDFGYPAVMWFTDANGLDMVSEDNGYNWAGNNLDFSDRVKTSREAQIVWNQMYSIIYAANNVVNSISMDTEDNGSKYYLAQGLATRAYSYFVLAQLYQFNYVENKTAACVPLITNKNSNQAALEGMARASVEEVYTQILTDINDAVTLLKAANTAGIQRADKRYISLAVAYGIRARINLTMQNWTAAAADANDAITEATAESIAPASIADVSKPTFSDVTEKNWMWGIIISETDRVVTSGIVNWISHMGSLNYGYANFSGGMQINKKLYNTIPASDVRKNWWLATDSTSSILTATQQEWMKTYKYRAYTQVKFAPYANEVGTSTNANDIPLMRIEEMYLIKAEAEAMSGGDGKTTLENFIKTYRDAEYVCAATGAEEVRAEVIRHRRVELWGEGLSWFDLMRTNSGIDRRGGGYPNATMIFNIPAKDPLMLWPIPEAEIQANPKLDEADNNPTAPTPQPVTDL